MLAIKSLFVALKSIQVHDGNPYPRLTVWIGLAGQLFIPILSVINRYAAGFANETSVALSLATSFIFVIFVTRNLSTSEMKFDGELQLRCKIFFSFFLPLVAFVCIARISPILSLSGYLVYSLIPLQRILKLPLFEKPGRG